MFNNSFTEQLIFLTLDENLSPQIRKKGFMNNILKSIETFIMLMFLNLFYIKDGQLWSLDSDCLMPNANGQKFGIFSCEY